ncbi:lipopolysaccharide-induced tumor necrosis factor-alpha factor homolog isoform X1 [Argonauta hians]
MSEPPPPPYPGAPPYPSAPGAQYPAPPYPAAPYPEKGGVEPSAPGYMHPPPPQPMMHPQGYGQGPPPPQGPPGQAWVPPPPPNAWVPPPQAWAPPPGYGSVPSAPAAVPQNTTVVIQSRPYLCHFGEASVQTSCPKCKAEIMTATHYETGNLSWVICLVLSFFGCIFGCCLLPFCMDNTKDVIHSCPNCNNFIGRYSRL